MNNINNKPIDVDIYDVYKAEVLQIHQKICKYIDISITGICFNYNFPLFE